MLTSRAHGAAYCLEVADYIAGGGQDDMDQKDADRIAQLAAQGKQISKIASEDFPQYGYSEVYFAALGRGVRSAQGVKKMITHRLNKLVHANQDQQKAMIAEINELVCDLYQRLASNEKKLSRMSEILKS